MHSRTSSLEALLMRLCRTGLGEWKKDSNNSTLLVYWKSPQDWAQLVTEYIARTGQQNSIMTLFELLHGDETQTEGISNTLYYIHTTKCLKKIRSEFHGMDEDVFKKALEILVKANKAQTFVGSSAENMGVKFF